MEINVDVFDTKSIDAAIAQLRAYERKLESAEDIIVDELLNIGYKLVKENVLIMVHPLTGEIASSIVMMKDGKGSGMIVSTSEHAIYVEFGTGVKGEQNKHDLADEFGYKYDINNHGDSGWFYPTIPEDPNPTKFVTKDGQLKAWTAGQASHPFMYDSAQELRAYVADVVRRALQ